MIQPPRNLIGFHMVTESKAYVIESRGSQTKYDRTLEFGFHFINPFVYKVGSVWLIDEQKLTTPPQQVIKNESEVNFTVELMLKVIFICFSP